MDQSTNHPKRDPIWKHPSRLWRYYRLRLMRIQASPEAVANGLAIGVFVGLLPIVPFHTVTALGLAILFRGSKAAALLGTLVSNPLDMIPHYMLIYYLGHKVLPLPIPPFSPSHIDLRALLNDGWELLAVLMTGGLLLAMPCALAAYGLSLWAVRRYRNRQSRHPVHRSGSAGGTKHSPGASKPPDETDPSGT